MRNQEGKIELQKKVYRRIYVKDIIFFLAAHTLSYAIFCRFFLSTPSPFPSDVRVECPIEIHNNIA